MSTPAPIAPASAPVCGHTACTTAAVAHWTRRLTAVELAAIPIEQHNTGMQLMVYACGPHAITLDLAARIHQPGCSGPNAASLPTCDCTPELPATDTAPVTTTLATGWQIGP
ncbi:hypothetical protein [Kitasatospora sp. NBC_01266]|uniref:hypothetical protein n=1 Tax=Kitasatospora sp. NBC_01266 TaxID=2903572 RepID=UPI002E37DF9C|nr:hypothetical protein [Kitasatospora sp. NBC_01266]